MKTMILAAGAIALAIPATAAETATTAPALARTATVPLAPDGKVVVDETWGDLEVLAWDRPEVEVAFSASVRADLDPEDLAAAEARLARFGVDTRAVSPAEVTVTGVNPGASVVKPFGGKSGIRMRYTLHVPRRATLVVRHGIGSVKVSDLAADVDVGAGTGELTLALPLDAATAVEASTGVGDVTVPPSLRETGELRRRALVGQRFSYRPAAPARRVVARLSIGSIEFE